MEYKLPAIVSQSSPSRLQVSLNNDAPEFVTLRDEGEDHYLVVKPTRTEYSGEYSFKIKIEDREMNQVTKYVVNLSVPLLHSPSLVQDIPTEYELIRKTVQEQSFTVQESKYSDKGASVRVSVTNKPSFVELKQVG